MAAAAGTADLLDEGKLESAALRPQNAAYYEDASLMAQAALLIAGIALAHAYSDGNKRLALLTGDTFLRLNGMLIHAEEREFAQQVLDIVNRHDELSAATMRQMAWLEQHGSTAP
jgi:death-on-curing protein